MNLGTPVGLIGGIALVIGSIFLATDRLEVFFSPSGLMIVIGGVIATALVSFPMRELSRLGQVTWIVLSRDKLDIGGVVRDIQALAALISREGLDALDEQVDDIQPPFLRDGVEMLLEQVEPDEIGMVMDRRIEMTVERELAEAKVLRTLGRIAPAFGLIGTVIGLVVMMVNLDMEHFDQLGVGLATALTTTFYGLIIANVFLNPLANRLEARAEERAAEMRVITEGVMMLARRMPATLVHHRLLAFIPPRMWSGIPSAQVVDMAMDQAPN